MAQVVLGVAGAVVGGFFGMPQVGYMIGSALGAALFPEPGADGPRMTDLKAQSSQYGAPIPVVYGVYKVAVQIIWSSDMVEHPQESDSGSGGGGSTHYTYTQSFAASICEGIIKGARRIWFDSKLVYDLSEGSVTPRVLFKAEGHTLYLGGEDQLPDPTMEAHLGVGNVPAYRGQALLVVTELELGKYGNRLPNVTVEVVTEGVTVVPPVTVWGEAYHMGSGYTFSSDMSPDGHLWLHTMTGHAYFDEDQGKWLIDEDLGPGTAQVQEYDAVTKELLWAYNVPVVVEDQSTGGGPFLVSNYPIRGEGVYSGGRYFIGRGYPGFMRSAYIHGISITDSHAVELIIDQCSHKQFGNHFYWPSVPVPVIDGNKVFMASGNGLASSVGIGFRPASTLRTDGTTSYNHPDRTGDEHQWVVPAGWFQVRPDTSCATSFDGVNLALPDWAFKSMTFTNPNFTIVQGYAAPNNYLSWVGAGSLSSGNDLSGPSVSSVEFPGSSVTMPSIAWDKDRDVLWVFYGDHGHMGTLAMVPAGGGSYTDTGFSFPSVPGEAFGDHVLGMTMDTASGNIRLLRGGGGGDVYLVLLNPDTLTVVSETLLNTGMALTPGKMWDMPDQGKVIYTNGYYIFDIPYTAPLLPEDVSLAHIVRDISLRTKELTVAQVNVTQLEPYKVPGYCITQNMTARGAIEPLAQAYFVDSVETNRTVKFVKRGAPPCMTIPMRNVLLEDK